MLDLILDQCDSIGEGGLDLLFGLVDEDSSDLLVHLGVYMSDRLPSGRNSISLRTREF
jgi:hypothetical protein